MAHKKAGGSSRNGRDSPGQDGESNVSRGRKSGLETSSSVNWEQVSIPVRTWGWDVITPSLQKWTGL